MARGGGGQQGALGVRRVLPRRMRPPRQAAAPAAPGLCPRPRVPPFPSPTDCPERLNTKVLLDLSPRAYTLLSRIWPANPDEINWSWCAGWRYYITDFHGRVLHFTVFNKDIDPPHLEEQYLYYVRSGAQKLDKAKYEGYSPTGWNRVGLLIPADKTKKIVEVNVCPDFITRATFIKTIYPTIAKGYKESKAVNIEIFWDTSAPRAATDPEYNRNDRASGIILHCPPAVELCKAHYVYGDAWMFSVDIKHRDLGLADFKGLYY